MRAQNVTAAAIIYRLGLCHNRLDTLEAPKEELHYRSKPTTDTELPMNWDNVIEMSSNNMEISALFAPSTRESSPATVIPRGKNIENLVERGGYNFRLFYLKGTDYTKNLDTYSMKRLHVERHVKAAEFKFMLCFLEFYARGNTTLE